MNFVTESWSRGIRSVFRFSGADTPRQFWPYAIAIMVAFMVATFAAMIPHFVSTFARMQAYAAAHPENATVVSGPGHYSISIEGHHPELMPDFQAILASMSVIMALVILPLAAAVARRLRDAARSPAWGLLPLPFLVFSMVKMPGLFASIEQPDLAAFFAVFFSNLVYLVSVALLVVFLCGKSTSAASGEIGGITP